MYDIVSNIIDHNWLTQNAGEQQYIYYICGALIVMFTVVVIDLVYRVFSHFWRGGR